jgi:hypothetical protein
MASPGDLDALSPTELKALVVQLLGKVAALERTVAAQRAEIAQLKGLKGRPALKPSGMEKASEPKPPSPPKGRRGPVTPRVAVEDQVIEARRRPARASRATRTSWSRISSCGPAASAIAGSAG